MKVRFTAGLLLLSLIASSSVYAVAQEISLAEDLGKDNGFGTAQTSAPGGAPSPLPQVEPIPESSQIGSFYIPVDSWVYPAMLRLFSLGYADSAYLGLRPWTRLSILGILRETADKLNRGSDSAEAREIYEAVRKEMLRQDPNPGGKPIGGVSLESAYTRLEGIAGTPLNDSFHLGQTIINDYGRPFQEGFNNLTGFSAASEAGRRFSLYFRGEYQHAPSAAGYSTELGTILANIDETPLGPRLSTIPVGPLDSQNNMRVVEAYISANFIGHEFSFGKSDEWMGPAQGASMAYSNNAENIYSFRINRVTPLRIPGLSKIIGPIRYDFLVGSLKEHTYPNDPWVHAEKISFKPTRNLEFGFERTVIWGGKDHVPITIHSFLKSFFSVQNVTPEEKFSRDDPGARFGTFDFSYRLPYLRDWLTLYTDSTVHDDTSPISAPRRAGWRPGLYLAKFPGEHKLDLRAEGVYTETVSRSADQGHFLYWEGVQRQGYTNKGFLFGDWIGRQGKGGQAWLTYHLSGNEDIQFNYRRAKVSKDFVPGGTTQDDYGVNVVKRLGRQFEINASTQIEHWKAPIYKPGAQNDAVIGAQITWLPSKAIHF
jgi:capsule assembly protein Wzi